MKHIPFAALPLDERTAVVAALQRCGLAPRQVCVTRLEPGTGADDEALPGVTLVSAPGWFRAYDSAEGWVVQLEYDLGVRARG